jgi:hypothetical protein
MEDNLNRLLNEEKEYRLKKNYHECYIACLKILDEIQNQNEKVKYDIISQIFLYPNQSNYVKLNIINSLIKNFSFINNKITKKKYYQLLIDSFSKCKDKEYQSQISKIKQIYEKNELKNFIELDKYISDVVNEIMNKTSSQNYLNTMNSTMNGESSIINLSLKTSFLNDDAKQYGLQNSLEDIISERNSDLISTTQESLSEDNNINRKKISEIKNLMKKYRADPKAPMVIISVSANLNSKQFLDLINENFEKFSYKNICTIKDTERDNIRVYEYYNKNCLHNFFSKICKDKNSSNKLQVISLLKRDENNFDTGINSILNDAYERKISIKTIKGNPQTSMKIIVKFLRNFSINAEKIKVIKQSKCFLRYNLESDLKNVISIHKTRIYKGHPSITKKDNNDKLRVNKNNIIDETLVEKTNDDASRYYEMYKVFSKKEYGLGKTISEFIDNFKKEYKFDDKNLKDNNFNKIDTRNIMMKIVNIFENSINTLNSTFNIKENNIKSNNTTFYANAAEQFILNKIYPELYNIYNIKYKNDNELYLQKKKEINENLTIDEICKKIGIKQKLKGNDKIPFKRVIDIINKIVFEKSLKKKYEIMTQASLELRNCVLDNTNCKYELDSMDDELPIIIYIATQLEVDNLYAELYMIEDYIKCSLRDKLAENKTVTNLMSSLLYISKSWDDE